MLSFIFFVIVFILFVGLFIIMAVFGFVRKILGLGKKPTKTNNDENANYGHPAPRPKIFDKKEGEYVDFEEIK